MKLRNLQSVLLAGSGLLLAFPSGARAADVAVTGVVRDSSGAPQMDVLVQLLRSDATVIQSARTDMHGTYLMAGVMPGVYQLKAIETSFLPTLRENLRITGKSRTEANLTLSTLMEALSWLPAHKRGTSEPEDDWTWTLRSAAYRPLLRIVDADGLETVEDPAMPERGRPQQTKGRLLIESGTRAFGDGGMRETVEVEHRDRRGAKTLVRGQVSDQSGGPMAFSAGYAQANTTGSGMTTMLAYRANPGVMAGNAGRESAGLQQISLQTAETIRLLPELVVAAGSRVELFGLGGQQTMTALPFADATWSDGDTTLRYAFASAPEASEENTEVAGEHDGGVRLERGLHQELKLEHSGAAWSASIAVYRDRVATPGVNLFGRVSATDLDREAALYDPVEGVSRVPATGYSSTGAAMEARHQGPGTMYEAVGFASGNALGVEHPHGKPTLGAPALRAERAQSLNLAVGGKAPRTGTTWRAAYRMEPADAVTAVDLFDSGMADAYLNVLLRQPLHHSRMFPGGLDAVVDVNNLLAQGYHPFLTEDGNTLFFAQVGRSVQGGLAFYF